MRILRWILAVSIIFLNVSIAEASEDNSVKKHSERNISDFRLSFGVNYMIPDKSLLRSGYNYSIKYIGLPVGFDAGLFYKLDESWMLFGEIGFRNHKMDKETFLVDEGDLTVLTLLLSARKYLNDDRNKFYVGAGVAPSLANVYTALKETDITGRISGTNYINQTELGIGMHLSGGVEIPFSDNVNFDIGGSYEYSYFGDPLTNSFGNLGGLKAYIKVIMFFR